MTEELFRQDSYQQSCNATVIGVGPGGVVLDVAPQRGVDDPNVGTDAATTAL